MHVGVAAYIEGSEILSLLGDIDDGSAAGSLVCHDDMMDE
jgi:hypothetical protein